MAVEEMEEVEMAVGEMVEVVVVVAASKLAEEVKAEAEMAEEEKVEAVKEEEEKAEGVREEEVAENKLAVAEKAVEEEESKQVVVGVVRVMGVYKLAVEGRKEREEAVRAPALEVKVVEEGARSE